MKALDRRPRSVWKLLVFSLPLHMLALAAGYWTAALPTLPTPLWPAPALALALELLFPGSLIGFPLAVLLVDRLFDLSPLLSVFSAVGQSLEVLTIVWLIRKRHLFNRNWFRLQDVLYFTLFAFFSGTLVNTVIGGGAFAFAGKMAPGIFSKMLSWWLGDSLALLIFTPMLLCVTERIVRHKGLQVLRQRGLEIFLLGSVFVVTVILATGIVSPQLTKEVSLEFLPLPLIIWISLRFRETGATFGSLLLYGATLLAATMGQGPLIGDHPLSGITYLTMMSIAALLVAATSNEKEQAALQMQKSRERLKQITANLPGVAFSYRSRPEGGRDLLYVSPGLEQLVGEDLAIKLMRDPNVLDHAIPESHRKSLLQAAINSLERNQPLDVEYPVSLPGDQERWMRSISRGKMLPDGSVLWNGLWLDVTDKHKTEAVLNSIHASTESATGEVFFQNLLEQAALALDVKMAFVGMVGLNEGGEREIKTTILWNDGKFSKPRVYTVADTPSETVIKNGFFYCHDGISEKFPEDETLRDYGVSGYAAVALKDSRGEVLGVLTLLSNTGMRDEDFCRHLLSIFALRAGAELERLDAETRLKRSEGLFRALSENGLGVILTLDSAGHVQYASPALDRVFSIDPKVLRKEGMGALLANEELELFNRCLRKTLQQPDSVQHLPKLRLTGSREDCYCECLLSNMMAQPGVEAIVVTLLDISTRIHSEEKSRRLEEQLIQSQKMESLGLLSGRIAHDFNNLLQAITGSCSLAGLCQKEDPEGVTQHLARANTAAQRAAELCRQLLVYSGKAHMELEPVSIAHLVKEMSTLLHVAIPPDIRLKLELGHRLPLLRGDATQLRQVVMNLIRNAADAIGSQVGEIRIRVKGIHAEESPDLMECDISRGDPLLELEIADTGCGMSAEVANKIFDPYFTTKTHGHGLGMSSVLGIIRAHGGIIRVWSQEGRGSRFRILLPLPEQPALKEEKPRDPQELPRGSGQILVVDDEEFIRDVARSLLQNLGYRVTTASDGLEALELLARNEKVDLVLLDMSMPKMDGLETLLKMRQANYVGPVIISSGFTEHQDKLQNLGDPMLRLLPKPWTIYQMGRAMQELLQKHGPSE